MGLNDLGTPQIYMQIFGVDALTHFAREDTYILEVSQKGQ